MGAGGHVVDLGRTLGGVVVGLGDDRTRHAKFVAQPNHLGDLPAAVVGESPIKRFTLGDDGLVEGRRSVVVVKVVNIHVVGFQARQAEVDGVQQPLAAEASLVDAGTAFVPGLGGDYPIFAVVLGEAADDALRFAIRIGIGGLDEVVPGLAQVVDNARRLLVVGKAAEEEGDEAER